MNFNFGKMVLDLGNEPLTIQRRYEALGALNDFFIGLWFLIGSCFFLYNSLTVSGVWLFIIGSAQLLIKPIIKLVSLIHVSRVYHANKKNKGNSSNKKSMGLLD